ncbi:unnamed protein product [Effrenium voratum]|nr:unnamed protein product [Effrenium voratum]
MAQVFNAADGGILKCPALSIKNEGRPCSFIHKWGGCRKKKEPPADGEEVPPESDGEDLKPDEWQGLRCEPQPASRNRSIAPGR